MNTPILTKEQQKKTMSAKKKGPIKGLRNVLAQPFEKYWPVLKNDQGGTLEKIIKKSLAPLHRPKTSLPWSQLRKMKREERLQIKKSNSENVEISPLSKLIVTGINAVTRSLEKKTLSSVLLDSNVESILINHIVTMSETDNIPVILIPCLKSVTLETLGFASAAFALKMEVKDSTENHFRALYDTILELSSNFERPRLQAQSESSEDETTIDKNVDNCSKVLDVKVQTVKPTFSSDVYLYRSSNKERTFVPDGAKKDTCPSADKQTDFVPFGKDTNFVPFGKDTDFIPMGKDSDFISMGKDTDFIPMGKDSDFIPMGEDTDFIPMGDCSSPKKDAPVYIGISGKMILNKKGFLKNISKKKVNKDDMKNVSSRISETGKVCETLKAIKRKTESNSKYVPLKIKRIQGNENRKKATKVPKSKSK